MKEHRLIVTLEQSHRLFKLEVLEAQDAPYPEYCRFLMYVGFASMAHEVLTACVMYPTSIDSCRDSLADLSHSFYQVVGKFRLSQLDQQRLTRLIDRIGHEVIRILDDNGFYMTDSQSAMIHGGEVTASASIRVITPRTFDVIFHEDVEPGTHSFLSQQTFGDYNPDKWSH